MESIRDRLIGIKARRASIFDPEALGELAGVLREVIPEKHMTRTGPLPPVRVLAELFADRWEEALALIEERGAAPIGREAVPDAHLVTDGAGRIREASAAAVAILGRSASEL